MTDCVFCAIVAGTAPARIVYRDEEVLGFLDIRPIAAGHTLLVPRKHSSGLADLPAEAGAALFRAGQRVAAAARSSSLAADGVNLALNDGRAAFQTVFHTHLHVVPRHAGDKLRFVAGMLTRRPNDMDSIAAGLRTELSAYQ
ncbi:MAG: HIT family protein [Gordonia sp. (in: high G+C Gram-positive bacteria)]